MTAMSAFPINKNNDLPLLSFQIHSPQQEPSRLIAMRKDNKKKAIVTMINQATEHLKSDYFFQFCVCKFKSLVSQLFTSDAR
jgi:hypothetical protein